MGSRNLRREAPEGPRLKIAIVGRPNVGKSTLFNRLAGRRLAIVDDTPGVTRDRREAEGEIKGLPILIIDTAGYEEAFDERLEARMREQTEKAIEDADVALLLVDARAGLTPVDRAFADVLRKSGKPVIVCANKAEARVAEAGVLEAFNLGLGEPIAISAEHGQGLEDVVEVLREIEAKIYPPAEEVGDTEGSEAGEGEEAEGRPDRPLSLAIVGRPNVGKSTLINTLLGEERLLTGPEAGITRDSIAVPFEFGGRALKVYDTAGMRRRVKVQEKLERLSVGDTLNAIRFADVVVLTMDALDAFEKQDLQIADLIEREGRAIVLAYNKWDLVEDRKTAWAALSERAERLLPQLKGIEQVAISGETGRGLDRLMQAVLRAEAVWKKRISTSPLNRWLAVALERHPPPAAKGRRIKIRYMTQAKAKPPTFVVFCQRADELPDDYVRYLINGIRERFGFPGVPLRLQLRAQKNPYAEER